jgi:hypothetical protein
MPDQGRIDFQWVIEGTGVLVSGGDPDDIGLIFNDLKSGWRIYSSDERCVRRFFTLPV